MQKILKPLSVYIHWPYCLSKCPYCDFASRPCSGIEEALLWPGYRRDMLTLPPDSLVTTVFFGGGTPSLMTPGFCADILGFIRQHCHMAPACEISMEANPDAITLDKMRAFREVGVNRLSVGVQSLIPEVLRFLGRRHSRERALRCLEEAMAVFPEVNMDLIYARPNQTPDVWQRELEEALSLGLSHYSLYQLTIEPETVFGRQGVSAADEAVAADLYRLTDDMMAAAGMPAYEVSNYAKPGHYCRHNLTYWRGGDYGAVGPAAHGRIGLTAIQNPPVVDVWLAEGAEVVRLSPAERQTERLMMGLRLRQEGYPMSGIRSDKLEQAVQYGWVIIQNGRVYPTQAGILMLNQLTLLLMDDV